MPDERDRRSMSTGQITASIDLACLPIGCSVSAKYRGAFCSAQVKSIDKQVKVKVTFIDTGHTITISEEQIIQPASLHIGHTVTVRLPTSTGDVQSHHSRNNSIGGGKSHQKKQAIIKHIIDNSIYTVVFSDGDETSLRRASLCLQGVRLYQNHIGQSKIMQNTRPPSPSIATNDANDQTSIVCIQRSLITNSQVFPALILKRKALPDYLWVKSFLDGKEYVVHQRDDVQPYRNNPEMQSLCRLTSKQATQACDKFIRYHQIPEIWQKKTIRLEPMIDHSESDINTNPSDDDTDDETTEEKDSFLAQLLAFMDDTGTPINDIPKVHNYDLDLHRLFKVVRLLGGFNKVTKTHRWGQVHTKMGLPDVSSAEHGRFIKQAYKKYLYAYEDLTKKLGTLSASSSYLGSRTSAGHDSRRSLIRRRSQTGDDTLKPLSLSIKPPCAHRSSTKIQSNMSQRKTPLSSQIPRSTSTDSDTSDDQSLKKSKFLTNHSATKRTRRKKSMIIDEKATKSRKRSHANSSDKTTLRINENRHLKPVIKIQKLSYKVLNDWSTSDDEYSPIRVSIDEHPIPDNISIDQSNKPDLEPQHSSSSNYSSCLQSIERTSVFESTAVSITTARLSSIDDESTLLHSSYAQQLNPNESPDKISSEKLSEIPSIFQTLILTSSANTDNDCLPLNSNFVVSTNEATRSRSSRSISSSRAPEIDQNDDQIESDRILNCQDQSEIHSQIPPSTSTIDNTEQEHRRHFHDNPICSNDIVERTSTDFKRISSRKKKNNKIIDSDMSNHPINADLHSLQLLSTCSSEESLNLHKIHSINPESKSADHSGQTVSSFSSTITDFHSTANIPVESSPIISAIEILPGPTDDEALNRSSLIEHNSSTSTRQRKRRLGRDEDHLSISSRTKSKLHADVPVDVDVNTVNHNDESTSIESKRFRTVDKRAGKRTIHKLESESDECYVTVNPNARQRLENMFKHRSSRYNFLDLNDTLTGDNRLEHLKDRLRQCQKVFFDLQIALTKIDEQKQLFLRQVPHSVNQTTTNELLLPSTCT